MTDWMEPIRRSKLWEVGDQFANKLAFMDLAMTPVTADEDLEMFHTPSAPAFLEQEHRRQHAHEHAAVA